MKNVTGHNWGTPLLTESDFKMISDEQPILSVPLSDVAQATNLGKGELVLEFQQDDSRAKDEEFIVDMRFFVPDEENLAELHAAITRESGGSGGEAVVCRIPDVGLLQPRGHHDVEFLAHCFRLRGKTFSYTVKYKNVQRVFLVPRPDGVHAALVLALEQPVRQGNTAYPFLVFQFDKEKEADCEISGLSDEQMSSGKLQVREQSKLYDLLARLFKALAERAAVMPAVEDFKVSSGTGCVRCSHRALEGHLYCMKKGFLFIPKPVVYIRFEDVAAVEFSRTESWGGAATKYFDLKVYKKNENAPHDFQQIERQEYQPLVDFLQGSGIKIKNLQKDGEKKAPGGFLEEELPSDEEDDEDFEDESGSEDGSDSGSGSGSGSGSDSGSDDMSD